MSYADMWLGSDLPIIPSFYALLWKQHTTQKMVNNHWYEKGERFEASLLAFVTDCVCILLLKLSVWLQYSSYF